MEWLLGNIVICIHSIKWSLRYAALRSGLILYLMSCCITFATLGNYNNPRHKIDFEIENRNPINVRESPKFSQYFNTLWKELGIDE